MKLGTHTGAISDGHRISPIGTRTLKGVTMLKAMFKYMVMAIVILPVYVYAETTVADCDFNNNGQVDFGDFLAFAQAFGTNQSQFDLDGNDSVDFQDFLLFVQFFGQEINPAPVPDGVQLGERLPDFTLDTIIGTTFNLYEYRGKPVFLNFWLMYSPVNDLLYVDELQHTIGDQMQFVSVNVEASSLHVKRYAEFHNYTWTFVIDSDEDVSKRYNISEIPVFIFLNSKGVIVQRLHGRQSLVQLLKSARQAIND